MSAFHTILGNHFIDSDGHICRSFQLVSNDNGRAFATLDLTGSRIDRFMFADSVSEIAKAWKEQTMKEYYP